jgi:hypothetical protein
MVGLISNQAWLSNIRSLKSGPTLSFFVKTFLPPRERKNSVKFTETLHAKGIF